MKGSSQQFEKKYATALEEYLAGAGETALSSAYELGRQALEFESGVMVVAAAHHEALRAVLLRKGKRGDTAHIIKEASDFFSECLSTFDMAQRGFQESIASLRSLNETLHAQQRDLRLLLSPMPNLLLTIDNQDHLAAFFLPPNFPPILKSCQEGMAMADVLPDEMAPHVAAALKEVRASKQVFRLEWPLAVSEKSLYFELQISPVNDAGAVLLVVNNITERKAMEIAEHEQRVLAESLRDIAIALNSSLDLSEVLNHIVMSIGKVVPHDTANIMLIENNVARIARSFGYKEHNLAEYEKAISIADISADKTPMLHRIVEGKQPVVLSDIKPYMPKFDNHKDFRLSGSAVSVPIIIANEVMGVINLHSFEPDFFTSVHAENLQIFANQAAIAIQNANLFKQAQEVAALNERQRLARELHDAVNQSLFAASMIAQSMLDMWERRPDRVFPLLLDLHKLIKNTMAEMRVLLWELRPAKLVSTPLDKLLIELIGSVQARTNMNIEYSAEGERELPEDVHLTLYRIAQESLNNIVKHSNASEVMVHLENTPQHTILRIRDNGQGFSLGETASGYGLGNMRERAQLIGASLGLTSEVGQGTEITVTWIAIPSP